MSTTAYSVEGLHCQGCANTVMQTIKSMPNVKSVMVDLNVKGVSRVNVDCDREMPAKEIQMMLDKEGNFSVV